MADAGDQLSTDSVSVVTDVHVDVDRCLWNYMNRSARYRASIEDIGKKCDVSVTGTGVDGDDCNVKVSLSGSGEMSSSLSDLLQQLVDECRQTVSTYTLEVQDADTCSVVIENLEEFADPSSALVDVDSAAGVMRLTGTREEINHALGLLEILGVPMLAAQTAPEAVATAPAASLQLWKEQDVNGDSEEDSIYASRHTDSPTSVQVDAKLWKYMQKSNGQWVTEITGVREKMGVVITESLTDDGTDVLLTFAGIEDDVVEATDRIRQLVDRCRGVVQTVDVVCPDSTVHAKVRRFLPSHLSKLPAYVAVDSDDRLTVTGTPSELEECNSKVLVKLRAKLQVSPTANDHPRDDGGSVASGNDEPLASTPWLNWGDSDVKQDLTEDERIARQLQEREDAARSEHFVPTRPRDSSDDAEQDGRQYAEIPVPIEDDLWSFVQKRRAQQLQQLREAYRVNVSTYPAAQEGFVVIAIEAESALMLECAQDELIQLLENLRTAIIVQVLQIGNEGEGGRQLPPQVGQLFNQIAEGTDAIIELRNNNIAIIGPEKAVAECQQKIAAFVQQVQQGGGMGVGGDRGRGMQLGGGGGGMGPSPSMSDAELARYMRMQGMQMPMTSVRGGPDDMMRAMMGGRSDDGGPSSFAPFLRRPPNTAGMDRAGPERALCPPDQHPAGGFQGLGPTAQGVREGADMRPFDFRSERDRMFPPDRTDQPSTQHQQHQQQQQGLRLGVEQSADEKSDSCKPRAAVRFAADEPVEQQSKTAPAVSCSVDNVHEAKACSVCQLSEREGEPDCKSCQHAFCVSCVQQYFNDTRQCCPVCGPHDDHPHADAPVTQPADGVMMVTQDKTFRLPGYETTSRGTIVVCYSFPPGIQKDFQPNPGRKYCGMSKTAFFPLTTEALRIVDLLQRAFDNRQLFAMAPASDGKSEEIVWNGIHHKTNIYGGPQKCGYPDPIYMKRLQHELHTKGFH